MTDGYVLWYNCGILNVRNCANKALNHLVSPYNDFQLPEEKVNFKSHNRMLAYYNKRTHCPILRKMLCIFPRRAAVGSSLLLRGSWLTLHALKLSSAEAGNAILRIKQDSKPQLT